MDNNLKICFVGSGTISTAMGNVLAKKDKCEIFLLSVEQDVVDSISNDHINRKYFPNVELEPNAKKQHLTKVYSANQILFFLVYHQV